MVAVPIFDWLVFDLVLWEDQVCITLVLSYQKMYQNLIKSGQNIMHNA